MKTKKKSKSSAEYWREREEKQRKKNIKDEKEYSQEIDKIYRQMMDEIEVQINDFYTRYAGKEGITYAQAKERVSKLDIERYAELAKKYVAEKNFSKKANDEMRLYNLTMKVNRLELLKANIGMRIVGGFDELQQFFDEKLTERTLDTFERQAGILGKTVFDNQRYAHAIVNASFHNATWSDRIWTHQDVLRNELGSLLSTGLIQGRNPKELARTLRKKVESSKYNANRLMITEMARVQTEAQKQSYEKNGFTKYTFHSLGTACEHCLSINGKTFDLSDMQSGVNAPPMHPNCRCSTSATIERTDFGVGNEEVADFNEWSETFDEHGLSWLDWLKKKESLDDSLSSGNTRKERQKYDRSYIIGYKENKQKTKEEVSEYFESKGITFIDGKRKTTKLDERWISEAANWHERFEETFASYAKNDDYKKLPLIEVLPDSKMKWMLGKFSYYPDSLEPARICINGKYFKDYESAEADKNRTGTADKKGYSFHSGTNPIHTFIHEYGHYVGNTMDQLNDSKFQEKFIQECVDEYAKRTGNDKIKTYRGLCEALSSYGTTNSHEAFAEAFSEYFGEENPKEFAKIFGEKLTEELNKW